MPIKDQGALDELHYHQTPRIKYKAEISLCRRNRYYRIDLDDIRSRFDKVRPVVSHIEFRIPEKLTIPKNIGEALKDPQR